MVALGLMSVSVLALHLWVPRPLFRDPTSTVVSDSHGALIGAKISADEQWRFPESDSISAKFAECIIEFEDRHFRYHPGIDPVAIVRAIVHNVRDQRVVEGGSTLTMQVARMARRNQRRNLWQKMVEVLWALDIECTYSKDEILRLYASHAPFGGNTVGVEAAAWRYFGRSASNLSWAENATLAVLPNSPALIHLGRNRNALKSKRDALLRRLCNKGVLTEQEYLLATGEPLPEAPLPIPNRAPHLLVQLAKQYEGERIRSTVDLSLQIPLQDLADRYSLRYKANYINDIAILVLDVPTGNVLAYIGNSSQMTPTSQVDNVRSERSTGSLLKPILYAAMISDGQITPRMLFADTPLNLNGFTPQNFSRTYQGVVPADEAVTRSLNVPLVRMLSQYGTGRFMSVLRRLGMSTLRFDEDHYGAAIILGGAEGTLWDMTHVYARLSKSLLDKDGQQVPLKRSSVWCAFQAMSALNRPEEEADWQNFSSMKQIAWKTGTSWGSRDAWSIGTTSRYAVGVWVGNSTGEGRAGMTGIGYAAPVMFDVFSLLDNSEWFQEPLDEMENVRICRHSGHVASSICADTEMQFLPKSCIGTPVCPYCRWVHLSADGRWQVNSTGESVASIRTGSWFVLPPVPEYYYAGHSSTYRTLPPLRPDCQSDSKELFSFITPEHGSTIVLPRSFGGKPEKVVLKAVCHDPDATLFWHLDDSYIGQTQGIHELAVCPNVGQHSLTIVDATGNRRSILFSVR